MRYTPESVDKLIASFPNSSLTKIIARPTFSTLKTLFHEIRENAGSIYTPLGGGMHGYQGITYSVAEYAQISPIQWVNPVHPGPAINPVGMNNTAYRNAEHLYNTAVDAFLDFTNVQNALKKQIREAIDEQFYKGLKETMHQYNRRSVLQFMTHLWESYGEITQPELMNNYQRMNQAYDTSQPFESMIQQIEEGQEIATSAGQAYPEIQLITMAYTLVYNTGEFFDACDEWNRKPAADKTWINFKTHFTQEIKKEKNKQTAMQTAGFRTANSVVAERLDNMTLHLNNLLTNSQNDKAVIKLLEQKLEQQAEEFKKQLEKLSCPQVGGGKPPPKLKKKPTGEHYCWSHGYTFGAHHTSKNCKKRLEGHQEEATASNNMGGSQKHKPSS